MPSPSEALQSAAATLYARADTPSRLTEQRPELRFAAAAQTPGRGAVAASPIVRFVQQSMGLEYAASQTPTGRAR